LPGTIRGKQVCLDLQLFPLGPEAGREKVPFALPITEHSLTAETVCGYYLGPRASRRCVARVTAWKRHTMKDARWERAKQLVIAGMEPDEAMIDVGLRSPRFRHLAGTLAPFQRVGELCSRAERLCLELAPADLADAPLYVAVQSQCPGDLAAVRNCQGFTSPDLDCLLRGSLGDRWRGRGPAMFIRDGVLNSLLDEALLELPEAAEVVSRWFLATAVHELAHILDRDTLISEDTPADAHAAATAVVEALDGPSWSGPTAPIPHFQHEWKFLRNCLHLRHRAELLGIDIAAARIVNCDYYGLSSIADYQAALDDEPARMIDASFRDIRDARPPAPFRALWQADFLRYAECRFPTAGNT
jgi:hypothetical protein